MKMLMLMSLVFSSAIAWSGVDNPWGRWNASGARDLVSAYGSEFYTRLEDLSGNGHDLKLDYDIQPGTTATEMRFGNMALKCAGMSDSNITGSVPAFDAFTVSFWLNSNNGQQGHYPTCERLYLVNDLNGLSISYAVGSNDCDVSLDGVDTGLKLKLPCNDWYMVTATVGGGNISIYLDRKLLGSAACLSHTGAAGRFFLFSQLDTYAYGNYKGLADEIRIYDFALTGDEIGELYAAGNAARLVEHWPCASVDGSAGALTTPNLVRAENPLQLGGLVSVKTGSTGEKSLLFDPPNHDGSAAIDSYGRAAQRLQVEKNDVTVMMRCCRDFTSAGPSADGVLGVAGTGAGDWLFSAPSSEFAHQLTDPTYVNRPCLAARGMSFHWAWTLEFSTEINAESGAVERLRRVRTYRDGELLETTEWVADGGYSQYFPANGFVEVGNDVSRTKPFRGEISDVRVYRGVVTPEFVRDVYRGPARVSAGVDFTTIGETAVLHGEISAYAARSLSDGYAGTSVWSLESAPAGGENASILDAKAAVTEVRLPVAGTYVFKLSNRVQDQVVSDTVTVTRDPDGEAVDPSAVSLSVKEITGMCATIHADVSAEQPVRLFWRKLSGPGGVWFSSDSAVEPVVTFSVAGDYEVSCTAVGEKGSVTSSVAVTVAGTTLADQLATGLQAYWPCAFAFRPNGGWDYPMDAVSSRQLNPVGYTLKDGAGYGLGVGGTYGVRCVDALNAYYQPSPALPHSEGPITMSGKDVPQEEWKTMSCWMYHDGSYLTPLKVCSLYSVVSYQMFLYLPNLDGVPCFRICQCDAVSTGDKFSTFTGPAENLTNRWVHVVFQANQHKTADHEVWVNGQRLLARSMDLQLGRYSNKAACFGGNGYEYRWLFPDSYNADVDPDNASSPYPFPGCLDEIRVYKRHLSESEIRYLYEHPTATGEALPPCVTVGLSSVKMQVRESAVVTAAAYATEASRNLTFTWSVIAGDASKLVIADSHALATTIVAKPRSAGEYAVRLAVFDGVRTTFSEPIRVAVEPNGLILTVR